MAQSFRPATYETANNNALARDPEFTAGFLKRHENKLIYGSDCICADGKGTGISQQGNPGRQSGYQPLGGQMRSPRDAGAFEEDRLSSGIPEASVATA